MRSFIGAFKALGKVVEGCSRVIAPLESLTAGRISTEKITLSESAMDRFNLAKESLKSAKTISIPMRSDQLWIVTDGAVKSSGIGATHYVTRPNTRNPLLAGFFSAKLKQQQPCWFPCELEALTITAACMYIFKSMNYIFI